MLNKLIKGDAKMKNMLSQIGYYIMILFILLGLLMFSLPVSNTSGKYIFSTEKEIELEIQYGNSEITG